MTSGQHFLLEQQLDPLKKNGLVALGLKEAGLMSGDAKNFLLVS